MEKLHGRSAKLCLSRTSILISKSVLISTGFMYLERGGLCIEISFFFLTRPIDVTGGGAVAVVKIFFF